jgi:hypothetical protein
MHCTSFAPQREDDTVDQLPPYSLGVADGSTRATAGRSYVLASYRNLEGSFYSSTIPLALCAILP